MKFDLPIIQRGNKYVKFNKDGYAEYGFIVEGGRIKKFINYDQDLKIPNFIVLPNLNADEYVPTEYFDFFMDGDKCGEKYINGNIVIEKNCFKGIKKATIIVPINTSVKLCYGCFDDDAKIDFVVSNNMGFKQIFRTSTNCEYSYMQDGTWTLLADSRIDVDFMTNISGYGSVEYNPEDKSRAQYELSINDKYEIKDGQLIRIKESFKGIKQEEIDITNRTDNV